ncbi:bifunctional D-cysteine desulfhydrase/1-aminocyclopropane-1-carboxylate deaminase, mitochondrial-like [Vitis riparia]|uniref:bifunctional D-cysteine desulfhydrase/1-aminocyclopropane-1-carboxylate deaminase, mitochondrial-like n=1 Tax=Vitis riparia TaxID=96939 RepID=UPI00155AFC9A|nr:bifunctional D-cysteine desulfhydrase/1-aminocyclopropane-1-carboxylate deaminase, mitochondrial-like [Vitis riparia]
MHLGLFVIQLLEGSRRLKRFSPNVCIQLSGFRETHIRGYIEAIREIEQQLPTGTDEVGFDDIVVACGSGATIAGLSLGSSLSKLNTKVHAFSVCDDPDYFYDYVQGLLDGLQAGVRSHDIVDIQNAKGLGYAINTTEELNFLKEVAISTGVVLDPVYRLDITFFNP